MNDSPQRNGENPPHLIYQTSTNDSNASGYYVTPIPIPSSNPTCLTPSCHNSSYQPVPSCSNSNTTSHSLIPSNFKSLKNFIISLNISSYIEMENLPSLSAYCAQKFSNNQSDEAIRNDKFQQLQRSYHNHIPLHSESSETYRTDLRTKVDNRSVRLYDIKCDTCSTRLVNPEPCKVLLVYPAKYHIGCPGCGWHGYVSK